MQGRADLPENHHARLPLVCALAIVAAAAIALIAAPSSAADPYAAWAAPERVDDGNYSAGSAPYALGNGSFYVPWTGSAPLGYQWPQSSQYSPADGWSAPAVVNDTGPGGSSSAFGFVVRPGNEATYVWLEYTANFTLWYADYTPAGGWGSPQLLSDPALSVVSFYMPNLEDGRIAVAWYAGSPRQLWASVRTPTGFSPGTRIDDGTSNATSSRFLLARPNGGATASFVQRDDSGFAYAWYNDYTAGVGWSGARRLDTNESENISPGTLRATGVNGTLLFHWGQFSNATFVVRYRARAPGGAWSAVNDLEPSLQPFGTPVAVSFAPAGFALGVWETVNASDSKWYAYGADFRVGSGWSGPVLLGAAGADDVDLTFSGAISFDTDSRGYLAWSELHGANYSVWLGTYDPKTGWQSQVEMAAPSGADAVWPLVIPYAPNLAVLAWVEHSAVSTSLHARWLLAGLGWSAGATLYTGPPPDFQDYSHALAVDAQGNAMVTYGIAPLAVPALFAVRGTVIREPLYLAVEAPAEGAHTIQLFVEVRGNVSGHASVTVNGVAVAVDAQGRFSTNLTYVIGTWRIDVFAVDIFGRTAADSRNITIDDPIVLLAAQIAQVQATLNLTWAALNATMAQLNASVGALAAVQTQLSANEAELNATQAELAARLAALSQTQADLNATRVELEGAVDGLNSTTEGLARANATAQAQHDADTKRIGELSNEVTLSLVLAVLSLAVAAAGVLMGLRGRRKPASAAETKPPEPPQKVL